MRRIYIIALIVMVACLGCQWKLKPAEEQSKAQEVQILRFDKIESQYLTTGDVVALQQMNTDYPVQTRTLIENILRLGQVDEQDINTKFYQFYQDSTLQSMLADVERQYDDMSDVNKELTEAFRRLHELLPHMPYPQVYTQVTALDQSIVVGNGMLGISLDKYLGADHPLYRRFGYTEEQRRMMTRDYIVPDCIGFYLISLYEYQDVRAQIPKIQYVVNCAMNRKVFDDASISKVEKYMREHSKMTVDALLKDTLQLF